MLFINNFASTAKTNTRNEIRLVNELTKIPGIEIDTIRTYWVPVTRNGCTSKELEASFKWHDMPIRIVNTPQGTTEVIFDESAIGEIYWDASTGRHISRYLDDCNIKLQKYIVDTISMVFFRISEKNTVIRMHDVVTINECKIMAEKAEITYIYSDGSKGTILCKNQFGQLIDRESIRTYEISKFIKRNYIVKD